MMLTALSTLSPKSDTKERQRSKSSTAECFLAEDWRSDGSDADLNNGGPRESRLKEYPVKLMLMSNAEIHQVLTRYCSRQRSGTAGTRVASSNASLWPPLSVKVRSTHTKSFLTLILRTCMTSKQLLPSLWMATLNE